MKVRSWTLGTVLAVLLLCAAGITFAAEAQPAPGHSPDVTRVRAHVVQGEIVSATAGEATVETDDGTSVVLRLGDDTHYWVPGSPPTHTLVLEAGDPVLAVGRRVDEEESGSLRALDARIVVVVEPGDVPRYLVAGRVIAVTPETVVVRARRGERAVTVLPRSQLFSPDGRLDSLRDVHRGELLIALGQPTDLGQWIAGLLFAAGGGTTAHGDPGSPAHP